MFIKTIIFLVVLVIAFTFFSLRIKTLLKYLKSAQPENRFDRQGERIKKVLNIAFGQTKLLREKFAGLLHFFIFWGFVILLLAILESIVEGLVPGASFKFLGSLYMPLLFLEELMGLLVIISVIISIIRRIFPPKRLQVDKKHKIEAIMILCWIFMIMVSMFFTSAGRIAFMPELTENSRFISSLIAGILPNSGTSLVISEIAWWMHIGLVLGFMNYLPYSKHLHILSSIPNVYLSKLETPSVIKPIDFDKEGLEKFGAQDVEDLSWKVILDGYTCTECGRCTNACPANITGKTLSPKEVMMKIRERSFERFPLLINKKTGEENPGVQDEKHLIGDFITEEALWSCTTCMSCMQECPVTIEHLNPIVELRRSMVMMDSRFPEELNATFRNLENNFSPWAFNPAERMDWADGLDVKTLAEDKEVEYLYWVGCAGAFDDRYKKVSRAFAMLLNKSGIKYGVLGSLEKCTGDSARRLGNEYLAQMLIKENVNTLNNYGVKKIITTCPHCFNALKNEYPAFGGNYEVIHHSVFINNLIEQGKIKISGEKSRITYHDSCYLGRYNGIYDEPRNILNKICGEKIPEMDRNHDKGLCCGAGGGRMFMEELTGKKINVERTEEALKLNPDIIGSACPFCMTMLLDGLKFKNAEEKVKVKDIAEIVMEKIL
jgi:Fe-S oxidoreductase/nitrate reductase gamma subunit